MKNNNFISVFIYLYIFFISWTHAFALSTWFRLPIIIGLITCLLILLGLSYRGKIAKRLFYNEEVLLGIFILLIIINFFINPSLRSINYVGSYILVFVFLYGVIRIGTYYYTNIQDVLKANALGVIFVSIFIVLNFVLFIIFGVSIQEKIPRLSSTDALYMGIINRAYGFSSEPGNVAQYFNALGPIALWWLWNNINNISVKFCLTFIFIISWLLLLSTAGIVFLAIGIMASLFIKLLNDYGLIIKKSTLFYLITFSVLGIITTIYLVNNPIFLDYLRPIVQRLTFDEGSSSAFTRITVWTNDIALLNEAPLFGFGLGSFAEMGRSSSLNWYLFLSLEAGLLVPLVMILFIISLAYRMIKTNIKPRYFFLTGLVASASHFLVISTFFDSFVWLLAIIYYKYVRNIHNGKII